MLNDEPKINKAICEKIEPLYDVWKHEAGWTEEEAIVMYHKLFDAEKPNDITIRDILSDKLDRSYEFYHERKIHRIYKRARKKLNKILP